MNKFFGFAVSNTRTWWLIALCLAMIGNASDVLAQPAHGMTTPIPGGMLRALLYGTIAGFAVYELLLGTIRRSATHIYCALAIVSIALLSVALTQPLAHGSSGSYAWFMDARVPSPMLALTMLAITQFTRLALGTANKQPHWNRVLLASMTLCLVAPILTLAKVEQAALWMQYVAATSCCIAMVGAALTSWSAGNRAALPLFVATDLMLLGATVVAAPAHRVPSALSWPWFDVPLGVLAISLLLSATSAQQILGAFKSMIATVKKVRKREKDLKSLVLEQHTTILETRDLLDDAQSARHRAELRAKNSADRLALAGCDDELTGVPNHTLFCRQAEVLLARARRHRHHVAIVSIEFDADALLSNSAPDLNHLMFATAQRLRLCVRACDIVGRTGPSQLAIAVGELASSDDVALVVRKLGDELVEPIELGNRTQIAPPRFGCAVFPTHDADVAKLIQAASQVASYTSVALYERKVDTATLPRRDSSAPRARIATPSLRD